MLGRTTATPVLVLLASWLVLSTVPVLGQGVGGGDRFVSRFYYAIEDLETALVVRRGTTAPTGIPATGSLVLAQNTEYRYWLFDPGDGLVGFVDFTTPASGFRVTIPRVNLGRPFTPDSDGDGLADSAEFVIGTSAARADSDGDGILDGSEIAQRLNPLDGSASRTGVIGSARTSGDAVDITAANDIAIVAREDRGISVFNVFNGMDPINILTMSTPGEAHRVASSGTWIAVADGSAGLAVIDVSAVRTARIVHQVDLGSPVRAVATAGDIAYAGLAFGGIVAVDLETGTPVDRHFIADEVKDVKVSGEFVYVLLPNGFIALKLSSGPLFRTGASGSPFVVTPNKRLFVGGGIAYAVHGDGYNTISLADPGRPELLVASDTAQFGWKQMVLNGSGIGFAAVSPNRLFDGPHHVSLYNVSDPLQTDVFITQYVTPGVARSVSIYNGIGYVADGRAGVQVINYLSADVAGVPPTIALTGQAGLDLTARRVEESKAVALLATVTDDVQVRNVEFYIDRQRVLTDGNFPFELRFTSPPLSQRSFLLRARASDTGGNATWTEEMLIEITPDETPPRVIGVRPADLEIASNVKSVGAFFDEPLDPRTVGLASFVVRGAGPDGLFNTPDDIEAPQGNIEYREAVFGVFRSFGGSMLDPGRYVVEVSGSVSDLGGNTLENRFSWRFTVCGASEDRDGDCVPDLLEGPAGLDPDLTDSDLDGISDCEEDFDGDGVTNCVELLLGTDLTNPDSDGDGIRDDQEDSDGDGLPDHEEARRGTNPLLADSDGDGFSDSQELLFGTDPAGVTNFAEADVELLSISLTLNQPATFGTLRLSGGAVLTHSGATTESEPGLTLTVGTLIVDATSAIDVSEKGYLGGRSGSNTDSRGRTLGNAFGASSRSITSPCCGSDAGGGGYGGLGGITDLSNPVYGDFRNPVELGSGGAVFSGGSERGGQIGGGRVRITADRIVLDGNIFANAETGGRQGGGSGGGIRIETGTLSGSGRIRANGGASTQRAGGGGGRIAVYYEDMSGFTGTIEARGDSGSEGRGAPGTVFLKSSEQSFGELIVDNGNLSPRADSTPLRGVGTGTSTALGPNTLTNSGASFPQPTALGAVGLIGLELNPDITQNRTFTIIDNTATQIFTDPADGDMTEVASAGDAYVGVYTFDRLSLSGRARVTTPDDIVVVGSDETTLTLLRVNLTANRLRLVGVRELELTGSNLDVEDLLVADLRRVNLVNSSLTVRSTGADLNLDLNLDAVTAQNSRLTLSGTQTVAAVTLTGGSVWTHAASTVRSESGLELIAETLSIDATSAIAADGTGYLGGRSGDNTSSNGRTLGNATGARSRTVTSPCCGSDAAGGSHGGLGSPSAITGPVYGDFRDPTSLGSGGAVYSGSQSETDGQSGGGRIRVTANRITLDGMIRADGAGARDGAAGGSGGSVRVDATILVGSGTIAANGSSSTSRGGGGGGRVAVYSGDRSEFTGSFEASGGTGTEGNGGAGTVFLKGSAQAHGDLIIRSPISTFAGSTPLRSVGGGQSTAIAPNVLTDAAASFPVPNPATGALGLIGLELNPNVDQGMTFTIIGNTATEIFTDLADGDMTAVAQEGDAFLGVYVLDNLSVLGRARVTTRDDVEVLGDLIVDPTSMLDANNVTMP